MAGLNASIGGATPEAVRGDTFIDGNQLNTFASSSHLSRNIGVEFTNKAASITDSITSGQGNQLAAALGASVELSSITSAKDSKMGAVNAVTKGTKDETAGFKQKAG